MHSTGLVISLGTLLAGASVVTLEQRSFDAHELFSVVERRRVTAVSIVGDAFALPILRALDEAAEAGQSYDTSSLRSMFSAGVAWSAPVKSRLLDHIPQLMLLDACGATDGGVYGVQLTKTTESTTQCQATWDVSRPTAPLRCSGGAPR